MNKRETVQALLDFVQKGDFENAKSMLADDFQFSGPIPEPVNRETFLGMSTSLKTPSRTWTTISRSSAPKAMSYEPHHN